MKEISPSVADLLISEAEAINNPRFIENDPVKFPRMFKELRDIEITSLLVAMIAWGKRSMICRDSERLLDLMRGEPYEYLKSEDWENLDPRRNIHRTFFASDLQYFMRGMKRIYSDYDSLDAFSAACGTGDSEAPAWKLVENMQREFSIANDGKTCSQCLPVNLQNTALKRINMALRWLVRDDGIVDMGVWKSIPKSKLFIPLDVHVSNTARQLGLLERKSNDRKAVEQLTATLRTLRPEDPAIFDYALFGLGVEGRLNEAIHSAGMR